METKKEIVRWLDIAAARSSNPATSKQCWYLASLIFKFGDFERSGYAPADTNARLSKRDASEMIDLYLRAEKAVAA